MTNLSCVRFSRIPTNGITLHVAEAGSREGPLLLLLHGFPEFWYGWRNYFEPLANCGFHVVAPDLRGYNLSDKPGSIGDYDLDLLAADIAGLADHFGQQVFCVAGHDWGGAIAWWLAGLHANRVRRLAIMNAPHPAVWLHAMHHDPAQRRKSTYVRFFRIPRLPEVLVSLNGYGGLRKGFRDSIRPEAFTDGDLEEYRKGWSQPGALTAMINYYRAVLRKPFGSPSDFRITCPTVLLWGVRDRYALKDLAEHSARLCSDGRILYFERSTHWLPHDEPEQIAEQLVRLFR